MNRDYWPMQPTFISDCQKIGNNDFDVDGCEPVGIRYPNIHGIFKVDELRENKL